MNKILGLELIAYSLLLAGLSYLTHRTAPALSGPVFITGLAGGVLCFAWGVRALLGKNGKVLPMLTLIPINFVLLSQAVMTWGGDGAGEPGRRFATVLIVVLFACSLTVLMRIAYAGALFDGCPGNQRKENHHV